MITRFWDIQPPGNKFWGGGGLVGGHLVEIVMRWKRNIFLVRRQSSPLDFGDLKS